MRIAIEAAKFTPDEANRLRRAMATFRRVGTIHLFQQKMVEGMVEPRLRRRFRGALLPADRGLRRIRLSRKPRRLLRAARLCLVLAEMPPSRGLRGGAAEQPAHGLLRPRPDRARRAGARRRGPRARRQRQRLGTTPWRSGPMAQLALRLGLRQIDGFREDWAQRLVAHRRGFYPTVEALQRRAGLPKAALVRLAEADAMRSHGARPARGRLGRPPTARRYRPATVRGRRRARARRGAAGGTPRHAAARACRGRLPDAPPVAEGPPDGLPARLVPARGRARLQRHLQLSRMAAASRPPAWCWCASSPAAPRAWCS